MVSVVRLDADTAQTKAAILDGRWDSADPEKFPYYGFYDVDLFDCPPFVMFTANDCPRAINIFNKDFELTSMRLWCALARQATCIVDVGAHVGVYSLAAASLRADVPVHAFEPNPYAYARLRMHADINKFGNINVHTEALADCSDDYQTFGWANKPTWQISSGASFGGNAQITVKADFLGNQDYDISFGARGLMKIDVEGAEAFVIKGAALLLGQCPDIILECFSAENCTAIMGLLPPGYHFYRIHEDAGTLEPMPTLLPASTKGKDYNAFLTTRDPTCLSIS